MSKHYMGMEHALKSQFGALDLVLNVIRVPAAATADTQRETVITGLQCSSPIEMKNDQKERNGYGTIAAVMMMWAEVPTDNTPKVEEQMLIVITEDSSEYLIRKVKYWPHIDPQFLELHVEDET